jgi:hypothetical protein
MLITSLPRKHVLSLFVIEMLYRHESSLSLTLPIGLQRSPPPDLPLNQATKDQASTNMSQNVGTCWNSTSSEW